MNVLTNKYGGQNGDKEKTLGLQKVGMPIGGIPEFPGKNQQGIGACEQAPCH
jgi:hypothetical protein